MTGRKTSRGNKNPKQHPTQPPETSLKPAGVGREAGEGEAELPVAVPSELSGPKAGDPPLSALSGLSTASQMPFIQTISMGGNCGCLQDRLFPRAIETGLLS